MGRSSGFPRGHHIFLREHHDKFGAFDGGNGRNRRQSMFLYDLEDGGVEVGGVVKDDCGVF